MAIKLALVITINILYIWPLMICLWQWKHPVWKAIKLRHIYKLLTVESPSLYFFCTHSTTKYFSVPNPNRKTDWLSRALVSHGQEAWWDAGRLVPKFERFNRIIAHARPNQISHWWLHSLTHTRNPFQKVRNYSVPCIRIYYYLANRKNDSTHTHTHTKQINK